MPFFVDSRGLRLGGPLGDRQVHRLFGQLRAQLGWVDRGGHGQPRVHDLGHSFAVRRLILRHEQGVDLDQRILPQSTYKGYVKISNTYWYLTGVPELMALAGARFERFAADRPPAKANEQPRALVRLPPPDRLTRLIRPSAHQRQALADAKLPNDGLLTEVKLAVAVKVPDEKRHTRGV